MSESVSQSGVGRRACISSSAIERVHCVTFILPRVNSLPASSELPRREESCRVECGD